jgi:S1-C subfamily serine protease
MGKKTVEPATRKAIIAALDHLTGSARGTATWLSGAVLDVSLSEDRLVRITESGGEQPEGGTIARLHRSEETYEIEAREAHPLWVNGERISAKSLEHRDLIEFGDTGPLSRFRLYREGSRVRKSVADIISDCIDYTRVSRKPIGVRVSRAFRDMFRGFARQTTVLFRISVIAAIVVLAATTFQQSRSTVRLQQQVENDAVRLESFASALTRARQEALGPGDLNAVRQELGHRLSAATERLVVLEERSDASARVIASATQAIVFLQGAYGFREKTTNRMLRHAVDDQGRSLVSPRGQPVLTLEGDGPVAERQFTGTAFVVTATGALLTNRHVALPWEFDASVEALGEQGMEPVSIRFIGYLPDIRDPFPVKLLKASDDADLAVLSCKGITGGIPHLRLSDTPPKPGDEAIVMGYPTGLRSMLAQTGDAFIEKLQEGEELDFWAVAARLSEEQFIQPLASRGIIGQVTRATVVYDAETTHGGSGGPVLDINGNVIAVNAAIIPEYGGSNLGVPAEYARRLLEDADVR